MTNSDVLNQYINYCTKEKTLSNKTVKAYKIDLNQFMIYINSTDNNSLLLVNKNTIKNYVHHLQDRYKIKSIKRKIAAIKAFYNYLVYEDLIDTSPFYRVNLRLKEPFRLPTVLNSSEINAILLSLNNRYIKMINHSIHQKYNALRDKVIIELLLNTGLRVSELCTLTPSDICLESNYIRVDGKGKKQRQIYIVADHLIKHLQELDDYYKTIKENRAYFFLNKRHNRYSEQSVRNMLLSHASSLDKKITPHILRHTFATILLEEGVDIVNIQHLLGHHSIVVTQIYTHVNMKKQKELLLNKLPVARLGIINEG